MNVDDMPAQGLMRLLIVTGAYPFGISEMFFTPEFDELLNRGFRLWLVPTRKAGPLMLPEVLHGRLTVIGFGLFGIGTLVRFVGWVAVHPLRFLSMGTLLFGSGLWKGIKNLAVFPKAIRLAGFVQANRIEHIHAHWGGTSATMAMIASRISGVPWSLTCHSWDVAEDNLLAAKGASADFVRFISERELRLGVELGVPAAKSSVIRMSTARISDRPAAEWNGHGPFRIACPAALVEFKGHEYLFEAVRLLKARGVHVELHCFGTGPLKEMLAQKVSQLQLIEEIRMVGFVPHDRLLDELASGAFHLVCLPSIVDSAGNCEGVPVAAIEAMGLGIPVVSTLTGSLPELVPVETGMLVESRNPSALAEVLMKFVTSAALHRGAAELMQRLIRQNWSTAHTVSRLQALIDRSATRRLLGL